MKQITLYILQKVSHKQKDMKLKQDNNHTGRENQSWKKMANEPKWIQIALTIEGIPVLGCTHEELKNEEENHERMQKDKL